MKGFMSILMASVICLASCSCRGQKINNTPVKAFDPDRFLGTWYEIARFDHSFERGLTCTIASYSLNADGTLTVVNSGIKNGKGKTSVGKAKLTDTAGRMRVSFFGPFYSDYRVLMLGDDYSYALVGSKSSKYLWILSRTPDIPGDMLKTILASASDRGYDTSKLIWVEQPVNYSMVY